MPQVLTDLATDAALDPEICRRARMARDPRFDGEFFLAVRTTGIYCRPVCPARPPAEKNVSYVTSAARAAAAGYRPCLRCRPESAPDSPAWIGSSVTLQRALRLIHEGALNGATLAQLAARLGVGERYLRKLFQRELGVSPGALALNRRLLFAKKLLAETDIPVTEVAFAAGFGSVRRFNSAVRSEFHLSPSALRRRRRDRAHAAVQLRLQYRPPYDWQGVSDFFARHAVDGIETVNEHGYRRVIQCGDRSGTIHVYPGADNALVLDVDIPDQRYLMPLVSRVRRMFDLDANPAHIGAVLGRDPQLAQLLRDRPGVRAPGFWSLYEAAVRAIVGQQVSTAAARTVLGTLVTASGAASFPGANALARLDDGDFAMPGRRRACLQALARRLRGREHELDLAALAALPGVGPWTTALVAMRGEGQPDVFPGADLGLKKAWSALTTDAIDPARWSPWGSYAANLLWRSLSP